MSLSYISPRAGALIGIVLCSFGLARSVSSQTSTGEQKREIHYTDAHGIKSVIYYVPPAPSAINENVRQTYGEDKNIKIAIKWKGREYTFYDQRAWFVASDSDGSQIVEVTPSDFGFRYTFYPSPDGKHLFVLRNIGRGYDVASLYEREGATSKMASIFPGGCRLDEAAWRYFARVYNLPVAKFSKSSPQADGYSVIDCVKWNKPSNRVYFNLSTRNAPSNQTVLKTFYDVQTSRFGRSN